MTLMLHSECRGLALGRQSGEWLTGLLKLFSCLKLRQFTAEIVCPTLPSEAGCAVAIRSSAHIWALGGMSRRTQKERTS